MNLDILNILELIGSFILIFSTNKYPFKSELRIIGLGAFLWSVSSALHRHFYNSAHLTRKYKIILYEIK